MLVTAPKKILSNLFFVQTLGLTDDNKFTKYLRKQIKTF